MRHAQAVVSIEVVVGFQVVKQVEVAYERLFCPVDAVGIFLEHEVAAKGITAREIVGWLRPVGSRQTQHGHCHGIDIVGMGQEVAYALTAKPKALRLLRERPGIDSGSVEAGLARLGLAVFAEHDGTAVERILAHGVEPYKRRGGLDGRQGKQGLEGRTDIAAEQSRILAPDGHIVVNIVVFGAIVGNGEHVARGHVHHGH